MSGRLLQARSAAVAAQQNLQRVLMEDYRPGTEIRWRRSDAMPIRVGTVLQIGASGRILVRREGSPRSHWIDADDVTCAASNSSEAA